jgi:hypothetical protein
MRLRADLYEHAPYKDVKGSWAVRVVFAPLHVHVLHSKREQSSHTDSDEVCPLPLVRRVLIVWGRRSSLTGSWRCHTIARL